MAEIEIQDLYKGFGPNPKRVFPMLKNGKSREEILNETGNTVAINGVSFTIKNKEICVVMGLSGSGKSTLIRCLNRLVEPTKGNILLDGKDIMAMSKDELLDMRRKTMSMVFQHFGLLPHRTVAANVEFGMEVGGMEKPERLKKAFDALKVVGLQGYENSYPHELSGGMKQRVGLARALANDPEILLMDEAFSALDPLIRAQMQDELLEIQAKMHKTIVFITHDLDEALNLGDRIVMLGPDGKIRQIGTPEEILTDPADEYVEAFVKNVDRTKVITASSFMHHYPSITVPREGCSAAVRAMEKNGVSSVLAVDSNRVLKGVVSIDDAVKLRKQKERDICTIIKEDVYTTQRDTSMYDLLGAAMETRYPIAVLDEQGRLVGAVGRATIIAEVNNIIDDEASPTVLSEVQNGDSDQSTEKERVTS